jgi:hypothetical protein
MQLILKCVDSRETFQNWPGSNLITTRRFTSKWQFCRSMTMDGKGNGRKPYFKKTPEAATG